MNDVFSAIVAAIGTVFYSIADAVKSVFGGVSGGTYEVIDALSS